MFGQRSKALKSETTAAFRSFFSFNSMQLACYKHMALFSQNSYIRSIGKAKGKLHREPKQNSIERPELQDGQEESVCFRTDIRRSKVSAFCLSLSESFALIFEARLPPGRMLPKTTRSFITFRPWGNRPCKKIFFVFVHYSVQAFCNIRSLYVAEIFLCIAPHTEAR